MPDVASSMLPQTELMVLTCSPQGVRYYSNEAWNHVFGSSTDPWDRLQSEDRASAAEFLGEAAAGSLVTSELFQIRSDDEEILFALMNFVPIRTPDEDGMMHIEAISVFGELLAEPASWMTGQTKRRRMEMIGRMTMGVAHDFNNLLSAILGYTELLKTALPYEESDLDTFNHLLTIERAALDGAGLVRKIQQYVRQEKEPHFEPLDLTLLADDCISLTRPYWYNEPRRKGISIEIRKDLSPLPPIMGAATELREVFVNLILNAVQAMPEGGMLKISTHYDPNAGVVFQIEDTGMGMPESVRNRIFEPMFTTKGEHGSGMGLAVSYGIVQEHDGAISVHSRPKEGTRFILTFPPSKSVKKVEEYVRAVPVALQAKILIVDDEDMVRSVLASLLRLKEHDVVETASGPEAIERARAERFDLVFTDLGMPEMSGREVARQLRQIQPDLSIVLLTGHTEIDDQGPDIDLVLGKPFKLEQLDATIHHLLGSSGPHADASPVG